MKALSKNIKLTAAICACALCVSGGVAVSSVSADANSSTVTMLDGASMRISEVSGLKFTANIDNYDAAKEYGMIIMPYSYVTDYCAGGDYHAELTAANVKFSQKICEPYEFEGEYRIACSITNVMYANLSRDFVGIAFVKAGDTYAYAEIDEEKNARSISEVAAKHKATDIYADYGADQKKIVDYYAGLDNTLGTEVYEERFEAADIDSELWTNSNADDIYATGDSYAKVTLAEGAVEGATLYYAPSYSGIESVQFDIRMNALGNWVGMQWTTSTAYRIPVYFNMTGVNAFDSVNETYSGNWNALLGKSNVKGEWLTFKYDVNSASSVTISVGLKGGEMKTLGTFTKNEANMGAHNFDFQNGNVALFSGSTTVDVDFDNFVIETATETITENYSGETSIFQTTSRGVETLVNTERAVIAGPVADSYVCGKLKTTGNYDGYLATKESYEGIKSIQFDVFATILLTNNGPWMSFGWNMTGVYQGLFAIRGTTIGSIHSFNGTADANGSLTNAGITTFFGNSVEGQTPVAAQWVTLKVVVTSATTTEVYAGVRGAESLTKMTTMTAAEGTDLTKGTFGFSVNCPMEIRIDNFVVETETGNKSCDTADSFVPNASFASFEDVAIANDTIGGNSLTSNIVLEADEKLLDGSVILFNELSYVYSANTFAVTFDKTNDGSYILFTDGAIEYYVEGAKVSEVALDGLTEGDEVTVELRLYKSGKITLRMNGVVTVLAESGVYSAYAILSGEGAATINACNFTKYVVKAN